MLHFFFFGGGGEGGGWFGLYGSFDKFVSWQWLGLDKVSKKLVVDTTANQVKIINMQLESYLAMIICISKSSSIDRNFIPFLLNFVTLSRTFGVKL